MDKNTFNKEIVDCRPFIRKARVRTIRRLIKKMKILKACKDEGQRDKKLSKANRLLEEVMILKKVREDDATKFALQNENADEILKKTCSNEKEHAYANLATQKEVKDRINAIREKIPFCEASLPELLKTLGARSLLKKNKAIKKGLKNSEKSKKIIKSIGSSEVDDSKIQTSSTSSKADIPERRKSEKSSVSIQPHKSKKDKSVIREKQDKISSKKAAPRKNDDDDHSTSCPSEDDREDSDHNPGTALLSRKKINRMKSTQVPLVEEEKVDDPFFVGKKVAIPSLLLEESKLENKPVRFSNAESGRLKTRGRFEPSPKVTERSEVPKWKFSGRNESSKFVGKSIPKPTRKLENILIPPKIETSEKLHPSWAAKRQTRIIKPFEGKKIKFDLD